MFSTIFFRIVICYIKVGCFVAGGVMDGGLVRIGGVEFGCGENLYCFCDV